MAEDDKSWENDKPWENPLLRLVLNHFSVLLVFTSLRLCILAIRGWLKSRELPLWSLKPPYFPTVGTGERNEWDKVQHSSTFHSNGSHYGGSPNSLFNPRSLSCWFFSSIFTSPHSFTSLRPCILAIRGWLKSRELPLWSLKPPYFPEMTLVSPLSETPTLGIPSWK
jgi:hypothetical protein